MLPKRNFTLPGLFVLLSLLTGCSSNIDNSSPSATTTSASDTPPPASASRDGSVSSPLRVLMLPPEGSSARDAFGGAKPTFDAITAHTGLHFEGKVGDSYASIVEGVATGHADLVYVGPYTYIQARRRNAAELLAVAV